MKRKFLKISTCAFLIITLSWSSIPKAHALFGVGDIVHDPINYIINGLKLAATNVGLLSSGLPGSGAAAKGAVTSAETGCKISDKAFKIYNTADSAVGVSVIAGDAGNIAQLSAKIAVLTAIDTCYDTVLEASKAASIAAGVAGGQQVVTSLGFTEDELNNVVISLDNRIDHLVELRNAAVKSMWEGVAFRILATVQQQITTKLINSLIAKYKISNYLKYADAVATQVYTANYVEKTYPDKADQLMIRSFLTNDLTQYDILPLLKNKADQNLGFLPEKLAITDPNYYAKLAMAGTGPANPYVLKIVYQDQAGATAAQAAAMAQAEMSQGQGFIPARDCNGVIAQQNLRLDGQRQQLGRNLAVSQAAYNKLQVQQNLKSSSVSADDLDVAAKGVQEAYASMGKLGQNADFFAKACADIKNPAAAISNFINSYLASSLNVINAPKPGNLPFFANFVETVATNFLTGIVNGGSPGVPSAQLLTESGFKAANVAAADVLQGVSQHAALKDADNAAQAAAVTFSAAPASTAGQYVVTWNAGAITGADHIAITATGLNYVNPSASGQITIRAPGGTLLTLKIFDNSNKLLTSTTFAIPLSPNVALNLPPGSNISDVIGVVNSADQTLINTGDIPPEPPTCGTNGIDVNGNPCAPPAAATVCGGNYSSYSACMQQVNDQSYCNSICRSPSAMSAMPLNGLAFSGGAVAGAFTSRVPLNPRGPALEMRPREK